MQRSRHLCRVSEQGVTHIKCRYRKEEYRLLYIMIMMTIIMCCRVDKFFAPFLFSVAAVSYVRMKNAYVYVEVMRVYT